MDPKRTILIADDTAMFRELGSLFLARTGRVVTASDGIETLEAVARERPSVVVADLDMPGMGGDELCRRIKSDPELRGLPVILVTGTDRGEDRARAVRAGADDVIAKPISRVSLIHAVNRLLSGQPLRGQARASLEVRVHILHGAEERWGTGRNLSRGGIFVEADETLAPPSEVALEFRLPGCEPTLAPTAEVVWRRANAPGRSAGMGMRFLALDRDSAQRIDAFVYENAPPTDVPPLAAGGSR